MTKEFNLSEKKCIVCGKLFEIQKKKSSGRWKPKGRQYNSSGNYTCSPKCARTYEGVRKHFEQRYDRKFQTFIKRLKEGLADFKLEYHVDKKVLSLHEVIDKLAGEELSR